MEKVIWLPRQDKEFPWGRYVGAESGKPMTTCGAYDSNAPTINGHYHYMTGECDTEPPYENGGPA